MSNIATDGLTASDAHSLQDLLDYPPCAVSPEWEERQELFTAVLSTVLLGDPTHVAPYAADPGAEGCTVPSCSEAAAAPLCGPSAQVGDISMTVVIDGLERVLQVDDVIINNMVAGGHGSKYQDARHNIHMSVAGSQLYGLVVLETDFMEPVFMQFAGVPIKAADGAAWGPCGHLEQLGDIVEVLCSLDAWGILIDWPAIIQDPPVPPPFNVRMTTSGEALTPCEDT
jgi:hypothetical protein